MRFMRFIEKLFYLSIFLIWLSILLKNQTIGFLFRSRSSGGSSDSKNGQHRVRQSISNTFHRIGDKISDKIHHRNPGSDSKPESKKLPDDPNQIHPQKPSGTNGNSFINNAKTVAGASLMASLAKKIFSSGSHTAHKHNYHTGMYYNYNYRPDRYSTINGEVCVNNYNYDGIIYGPFRCPIDGFDYEATSCCGPPTYQYCCTSAEKNGYISSNNQYDNNNSLNTNSSMVKVGVTIALVILFAVLTIVIGLILFCLCKKRLYTQVPTLSK